MAIFCFYLYIIQSNLLVSSIGRIISYFVIYYCTSIVVVVLCVGGGGILFVFNVVRFNKCIPMCKLCKMFQC